MAADAEVEALLVPAWLAVGRRDWVQVRECALRVLEVDPRNEIARKLLLDAIRAQFGEAGPEPLLTHLTVMFCDMVGSTALSDRLSPERYREVKCTFEDACTEGIDRYNGYVQRIEGDGLLVYFGYPTPRENDARRAFLAALHILEAIEARAVGVRERFGENLAVRIGIHSGRLLLGGSNGRPWARHDEALGSTPNIAARLQHISGPNEITASHASVLLADAFMVEPLGDRKLAGIQRPMQLFRVKGFDPTARSLDRAPRLPLVGRTGETAQLTRAWREARETCSRIVFIDGEPGFGKSRLLSFLSNRAGASGATALVGYCSMEASGTPLRPIGQILQRLCGISDADLAGQRLEKLTLQLHGLGSGPPLPQAIRLLGTLVGIPEHHLPGNRDLTPEEERSQRLDLLIHWISWSAAQEPILVVLEDLHWADPSTVELLDRLIQRPPAKGLLLTCSARPAFDNPWRNHPSVTTLSLNHLTDDESAEFVRGLLPAGISESVLEQILYRSDGVPLFLQELSRVVEHAQQADLDPGEALIDIPAGLQELLAARIRHRDVDLKLAQLASIIGRKFSIAVLKELLPDPGESLSARLRSLVEFGLIEAVPDSDPSYLFTHHLIYEAVYRSQLDSEREASHLRVAETLRSRSMDPRPEVLAYHYEKGRDLRQAVTYAQRAGVQARSQGAHREAIGHFTSALRLVAALPAGERPSIELDLRIARGLSYTARDGHSSLHAESDYRECQRICKTLGATDVSLSALWGVWAVNVLRGKHRIARNVCEEISRQAEALTGGVDGPRDPRPLLLATEIRGFQHFHEGELTQALEILESAEELLEDLDPGSVRYMQPRNPAVSTLVMLANVQWMTGLKASFAASLERAFAIANALPPEMRGYSQADARIYAAWLHRTRGDYRSSVLEAEAAIELAGRNYADWLLTGRLHRGIAACMLGPSAQRVKEIEEDLARWRDIGNECWVPNFLAGLAEARRACQDIEGALRTLDEAWKVLTECGERFHAAEILRLRGEMRVEIGAAAGLQDLREAADLASEQGALSFELRALNRLLAVDPCEATRTRRNRVAQRVQAPHTD